MPRFERVQDNSPPLTEGVSSPSVMQGKRMREEGKLSNLKESDGDSNTGELLGCGRRGSDAEFLELGAGAALFFGAGIALNDFAEFADAGGFLAEFDEGHALS